MSDDFFRIFIVVGVGVAALAFVVQAILGAATLRAARAMQKRVEDLAGKAEPVLATGRETMSKIGPLLEKAGPVIDKTGPVIEKIGPLVAKIGGVAEKAGPALDRVGPVADKLSLLLASAHQLVEETRPRVAEISAEAVNMSRQGRQQMERLGDLLTDAGERARTRLEQIDHTVESTVDSLGNVKRVVTRPAREVTGIAAGISAAVSALTKGHRRPTVDSATQDEEMFI